MSPHIEIIEGGLRVVYDGRASAYLSADQVALLICTAARAVPVNAATGATMAQQETVGGITIRFGADRRDTLVFIADAAAWLKRQLGDDPRQPHEYRGEYRDRAGTP